MKCNVFAILFLAGAVMVASPTARAAIHLNAGDSYIFEVTGFVPSGFDATKVGEQGFFTALEFGPDIIDYPEVLHADYYEDVLGGQWWKKSSIGTLPGQPTTGNAGGSYGPMATHNPFTDFQGIVHLWMETGSVDVKSLRVQLAQNGQLYERTFTLPVPVPEPASWCAIAMLTCMGGLLRRPRGSR
jgi:hypothetical protein